MGANNAEILARLTLNGEQFSSELAQRLGSVTAAGERAANDLKRPFISAFSEVQKVAQQAMQLPRTEGGALNLTGEIASLKNSAAAAEQRAIALREMAAAQLAASDKVGDAAQQLRVEADAARVAATVEDDLAKSLRGRVVAMEAVQSELNRSHSALTLNTQAANDNEAAMRRHAFGARSLGQQFGDMAVMIQGGIDPARAFATQAAQMGYAMSDMGGKMGAVGAFLTGPWGIALTIGLTTLAPLAAKLFETNDALDDQLDKLRKNAIETANADAAKRAFAVTEEGLGQRVRNLTKDLDDQNRALRTRAELQNIEAKNTVEGLTDSRGKLQSDLIGAREALAAARRAPNLSRDGIDSRQPAIDAAAARVRDLEKRLATIDKDLAVANTDVLRTRLDLADEAAQRSQDALAQIKYRYEGANGLIAKERERLLAVKATGAEMKAHLNLLREQQKAEEDAERKRQQAASRKSPALGDQLDSERGQRLLTSAQGFLGAREDTAAGRSTLGALFKEANVSIDPKMTAWCAAFVNAVLATNGLPGTSSLSARSFLGYGSSTDKPQKGDIVVLRRGDSATQGHVGFYAGEGRNGNVLVTGGNQGNSVSTQSFRRSDVLGFRRAPSAADSFADEERKRAAAAEQAKREAEAFRASVQSLTEAFDPAQAALNRYNKTLLDIVGASAAGFLTGDQAARFMSGASARYQMESSRIARDGAIRAVGGESEFAAGIAAWEDAMRAANDNAARRVAEIDDRLARAGDAFEQSIAGAADLFGVRVTGPMQMMFGRGGVEGLSRDIASDIGATLRNVGVKLSPDAEKSIASALSGAAYGQMGGSIFASITGGKQNALASSVGGILGNEAGKAVGGMLAKEVGGSLGNMLGGAGGPLGSIVGGMLGSVVGSLFTKTQYGGSSFTSAGVNGSTGNNAAGKAAGAQSGNAVIGSLNQLIDVLGGTGLGGFGTITIGTYKDKWRVNDHGTDLKSNRDVLEFSSQAEAQAFALWAAVSRGAVQGISAASQNILTRAKDDLQNGVQKAMLIESVPKDLKAMLDPVGAAVDALNRKFQKTVDALNEGGATAEQMAEAERLYRLQLDQTKASTASASQALKDFLDGMKIGGNSPLSLREQSRLAQEKLNPFLAAIDAGQSIDQSKYTAAAQSFLDIQRQLFGSTRQYFEAFDAVQAATNKAIGKIDNATGIAPGVPDPFTKATAAAAEATAKAAQTGNEMTGDTNDLLARNNALLERIAAAMENAGGGDFIGALRGFGQAA